MSKPFDLEAAKAGALFKRIEMPDSASNRPLHMIGVRDNGMIVYETQDGIELGYQYPAMLEMIPRKQVRYIVLTPLDIKSGQINERKLYENYYSNMSGDFITARVEWEE